MNIIRALKVILHCIVFYSFFFPPFNTLALPDETHVNTITIVENSKPLFHIVISDNSSAQIQSAAKTLHEYVYKVSSAVVPIVKVSELDNKQNSTGVWVGILPPEITTRQRRIAELLDDDGYLITFSSKKDIVIKGNTDWGTEFGVYEFIERFLGVRWLLPGPNGEYVPTVSSIVIPTQEIKEEPAFFSRQLSGLYGSEQNKWARRNKMHKRISMHHNLINIFPPEKYKQSNPEFFPMIRKSKLLPGIRYIPKNNKDYHWQPCFSSDGLVDVTVKHITQFFEDNPNEKSFSLGVNDSHNYCQCDKCSIDLENNYLGYPSYSNLYFKWANSVVEKVLDRYPDKWFGVLAYDEIAEPPKEMIVHHRIVPFITYDRMRWIEPKFEKIGKDITIQWGHKTSTIGWYDYIYGTPYWVPRIYFDPISSFLSYGHNNGVKAMYAEAYPNWGEGPKLYLVLKLLWDPYQDSNKLLNEWYNLAVGENAAQYLKSYYEFWESYWTEKVKESKWLLKGKTFLHFYDTKYLEYLTYKDIDYNRRMLTKTLQKAGTTKQKTRALYLNRSFEYYEASIVTFLGLKKGIMKKNTDRRYYESMMKKRKELIDEFENDYLLIHPLKSN